MKLSILTVICVSLAVIPLIAQKKEFESKEQIRILAVNATPEPETVVATIQTPRRMQVVGSNPIWMQVRINGYALGANSSQFERADELVNTDLGQTLHVVVDNLPYFPINGPSVEPFNEDGWYYNQNYRFEIPFKLKPGLHTLRIFPARSFGESLKGENTFHKSYFFIGDEGDASEASILSQPFLTYNEPSDQFRLVENKPVLLDFYINNTVLSPDGYKVKMTLDGAQRTLTSWQPYYIYGLKKGKHTIRLELIDPNHKPVGGEFNDVTRTFTVH